MADGNGWYVLRKIAQTQRDVPVVLVSAAPPDRPVVFPAPLDFAYHLIKPLDHAKVLLCLGELLGLDWLETAEAPPVSKKPLLRPSESALREMREMMEAGRVSDIMIWAEKLKLRNPNCTAFADQIRNAALDLDFTALTDLAKGDDAHATGTADPGSAI